MLWNFQSFLCLRLVTTTRVFATTPIVFATTSVVSAITPVALVTTINKAYNILVEEKFNQSDKYCQTCQQPPWSSPPSYHPRPQCR